MNRRELIALGGASAAVAAVGASAYLSKPKTLLHHTMKWETVVKRAEFAIRDSCSVFKHDGCVWLSNGYESGHLQIKDLWYSKDGLHWYQANGATPYLTWCPVTSYKGEIVAIGEKIYRSKNNGLTFTVASDQPPFTVSPETTFTWRALVIADRLVLFASDRIWWTTDLVTWKDVPLPWKDRCNCAVVSFKGEIHIFAGNSDAPNASPETGYPGKTSFNDHWKSADIYNPDSWVAVTEKAPWKPRMWPGFCVYDNHIVMAGGYFNKGPKVTNFNDTWVFDGAEWREVVLESSFSERHYPALFTVDGRLYITTGNRNPNASITTNDVLELTPA